jgi:hypothetical protein
MGWLKSITTAIAAAIPPAPDARTATRAARALNARRRKLRRDALIEHLASFGPYARGLDRLNDGEINV